MATFLKTGIQGDYALYVARDKISEEIYCAFPAKNDNMAVRTALVQFGSHFLNVSPLRDVELYRLVSMSEIDHQNVLELSFVDWKCYELPADNAEALSPLGSSFERMDADFAVQADKQLNKVVDKE